MSTTLDHRADRDPFAATRRWPRRARAVGTTLAVAAGAVWVVTSPRGDVPLPGPDATPEEVVVAYAEAISARDFATANAISPSDDHDRFSWPGSIDIEQLRETRGTPTRPWVFFDADFSGDATMQDGLWGYVLERGEDGRWQIVDAGVI
ncbi:hypothetical protein INN71_13430 [Nocardioides sp. ChNu-153]|uniref:hypothetical protein n=1 Tax=unclassified Nocardioides TaxID=2615069 RepID=UPI00240585EE|nr:MULTISPECIES: hypothetical protein [unclassified Nocardioides]MDF9718062.1 hypothetical protein [Nocardioides sp. ChNu-99]MDN7122388.1 hypothetical protein [Nocardioides sp. ChNu-153]